MADPRESCAAVECRCVEVPEQHREFARRVAEARLVDPGPTFANLSAATGVPVDELVHFALVRWASAGAEALLAIRPAVLDELVEARRARGLGRGRGDRGLARRRARGTRAAPAAGVALVEPLAAEDDRGGAQEDLEVEPQRAVLDVPEVELDPLVPRQRRAAVDLGPAGDAGAQREAAALAVGVLLDLHRDRGARADDRHVALEDVDEVRAARRSRSGAGPRRRA